MTLPSYHSLQAEPPKQGRRQLTKAQQALIVEHRGYARKTALSLLSRRELRDSDWESWVDLALCQTALQFDPSRGWKFRTLLAPRVRGAIFDMRRAGKPSGYRRGSEVPTILSIHNPVPSQFDGRSPCHDFDAEDEPVEAGLAAVEGVELLSRRLPKQHGAVIRCLYLDASATRQVETARKLGISESRVSQLHSEALGMLRASLGSSPGGAA